MNDAHEWFADPIPDELPIARHLQQSIVDAIKTCPQIGADQVAAVCLMAIAQLERLIQTQDSE